MKPTVRIGDLRHLVAIKAKGSTQDGQGGRVPNWDTTRATVWARVEGAGGRHSLIASRVAGELSSVVTIRFRDDVLVTDRLVHGSRTLQIEALQDPDGRRRVLELFCSEVQ